MKKEELAGIIEMEGENFDFFECAVIVKNLSSGDTIFSFNEDKEFYPASLSKLFVATEVIRKYKDIKSCLHQKVVINKKNVVDNNPNLYPFDKRDLLKFNDEVSIGHLLDLMLYRSDNTAANQLIDLVTREEINKNVILPNGWNIAKITRKYLNRVNEDEKYKESPILNSTAKIFSDFWSKLWNNELLPSEGKDIILNSLNRRKETFNDIDIYDFLVFYKGGYFESENYIKQHVIWDHFSGIIIKNNGETVSVVILTLTKNTVFKKTKITQKILNNIKKGV